MSILHYRRIVWSLAVAETIVWASMYYVFPALLTSWEADLGWSRTDLSFAFTLSLVISASLAPFAGRIIDRGAGLLVFVGGATLGAALLLCLSVVTEYWQFLCVWVGLGIAMSGTLYEAAFAVLMRSMGANAKRAIATVTILAGLAGTVSFPSAHALVAMVGWRGTTIVFALVVLCVAVPLIWVACRSAEAHAARRAPVASVRGIDALAVARTATFWLLATAAFLAALDHGMLISHVLPILEDRGVTAGTAVVAASLVGPMQVVGRLVLMASDRWISTRLASIACYSLLAVAAGCLLGAVRVPSLLVGFVVLQGMGIGIASIMRPVVTAELLGRQNFGVVSGLMGLAHMGGYAIGPTVAAVVWSAGGYDRVLTLALSCAALAVLLVLGAWRAHAAG